MVSDPLHMFTHSYAVPIIVCVGILMWLVHPWLPLFGLVMPMGYYFVTSGLHQIFSHYNRIPRNLPWMELAFPMGEWMHADHHKDASTWDFGRYDIGTYLIRLIKR